MILFNTDRLVARRLTAEDALPMLEIYGDPEAMRYVGDSKPLDEAGCRHWIEVTDGNFERRGYGMIAFIEIATGQLIGCGGIVHPGGHPQPEVKYAIRRDRWGEGFATEAVTALVAHGRGDWSISGTMIATAFPANTASHAVLKKIGFTRVADRLEEDGSVTAVWELPEAVATAR